MAQVGERALVIGGSIAGLMAARVLSDFFARVTILERDLVDRGTAIHKSVPQANYLHWLLQGGQRVLAALYWGPRPGADATMSEFTLHEVGWT